MSRGLVGSLLIGLVTASTISVKEAHALNCEFALYLMADAEAKCNAGDPDACTAVPLFQPNADACAMVGTAGAISPPPATTPDPAQKAIPSLAADPLVQEIQTLLKVAGFDPGTIDGKLGNATCNAARGFATARKTNVGCDDLIALRDALTADPTATADPVEGCSMLATLPEQEVISQWESRVQVRVSELDSLLRDLNGIKAALQGDLSSLTGVRAGISTTIRVSVFVAKFSMGKAALTSFLVGDAKTGALLLSALAVLQTAEAVTADLRQAMDLYMEDKLEDFRSETLESLKTASDIATSLEAMLDGVTDLDAFLKEQPEAAATIAELRSRIDALARQTWDTRMQIKQDRAYLGLLAAIADAKASCAERVQP